MLFALDSGCWNLTYIDRSAMWSAFDRRSWTSGLWPVMLACHGEVGHLRIGSDSRCQFNFYKRALSVLYWLLTLHGL